MEYSVRLTLSFGSKQNGAIERVSKFNSSRDVAPEVANCDDVRCDSTTP